MIIEGPLRISTETAEDQSGFSLQLSFTEEFQALERSRQATDFAEYLDQLRAQSATLDETDPNRQGMLIVLQVGEQLLPLVEEGSIPLGETLEIEVRQELPLTDFLASAPGPLN